MSWSKNITGVPIAALPFIFSAFWSEYIGTELVSPESNSKNFFQLSLPKVTVSISPGIRGLLVKI